jgi:2TM domain
VTPTLGDGPADARAAAVKRLTARRDFGGHVVAYLVVNAAVLAIWMVTGPGYFCRAGSSVVGASALRLHAWNVFGRRPISEDDIRRERYST